MSVSACADGFVKAQGGKLFLNGKEYRAVGVNIPFMSTLYFGTFLKISQLYGTPEQAKKATIDAIVDADKSGVAFIRFFASPGYPRDIDLFYGKDKEAYWRKMDELFALCKRHHLKVIPSLGSILGWQHYYNEDRQAILDPNSKSHKAAYGYIREFVTRYKDDSTVLLWELNNEGMHFADLDMQGMPAPPKDCYTEGAARREKLTRQDSLTWDMMLRIYKEQASFIKELDPNHPVTSGDAGVRMECTSRRETFPDFRFRSDTLREWVSNNLASQVEPLDVMSFHNYGNFTSSDVFGFKGMSSLDMLRVEVHAAQAAQMPIFFGELGGSNPSIGNDPGAKWARQAIDVLDHEGASLIALWVWHFPRQPEHTFDSKSQPELVKRLATFNRKHGSR